MMTMASISVMLLASSSSAAGALGLTVMVAISLVSNTIPSLTFNHTL